MRKVLFTIVALTILFLPTLGQDRFRISGVYSRTDFPLYSEMNEVENVNGFTVEADVKLFNFGKYGRVSVAYNFNRKLDQPVFPNYYDVVSHVDRDLQRDVNTHSIGGQIGYAIGGSVEPFAGVFYGARKIHKDVNYQVVRNFRLGLNIPFTKKSPVFIKGYLDYEQPYGTLPTGFVNPYNRTLNFGIGWRF